MGKIGRCAGCGAATVALGAVALVAIVADFDKAFVAVGRAGAAWLPQRLEGAAGVEPLDYGRTEMWAALPHTLDYADHVPPGSGLQDGQADAAVDVFFVHPTGYFGFAWNAPVLSPYNPLGWLSDALSNVVALVHTTPYNGVGRVFSPRFRQMTGLGFLSENVEARTIAMDIAYKDVRAAFHHMLQKWSEGRPLLLVGHSQGSILLARLLRDEFGDKSPLRARLVAAYLIGAPIVPEDVPLPVCSAADQVQCVVGYNVFVQGGDVSKFVLRHDESPTADLICVNPLTWRLDGEHAAPHLNKGSRPIPLAAILTGEIMGPLLPSTFSAQCREGVLWTERPLVDGFWHGVFPGGNFHGVETSFFFMAHRENSQQRAEAFLRAAAATAN